MIEHPLRVDQEPSTAINSHREPSRASEIFCTFALSVQVGATVQCPDSSGNQIEVLTRGDFQHEELTWKLPPGISSAGERCVALMVGLETKFSWGRVRRQMRSQDPPVILGDMGLYQLVYGW